MQKLKLSDGVVHKLPDDLKKVLFTNQKVSKLWESITPLARNEWICWVQSPKKTETRKIRINVAKSKLLSGMHRPCCWQGCSHR